MAKLSDHLPVNSSTKHTKSTKAEADYRSQGYESDRSAASDHCGSCTHYQPDEHHTAEGTCDIVSGSIKFRDVCDYYQHRDDGSKRGSADDNNSDAVPASPD